MVERIILAVMLTLTLWLFTSSRLTSSMEVPPPNGDPKAGGQQNLANRPQQIACSTPSYPPHTLAGTVSNL